MREIKFRGKTSNCNALAPENTWVYGSLINATDNYPPLIVYDVYDLSWSEANASIEAIPVEPETVGQYTGLKDKNGAEIFDGDIVECRAGEKYHGIWEHSITVKIEMVFTQSIWEMLNCEEIEVIGNIYENKELLEGENK